MPRFVEKLNIFWKLLKMSHRNYLVQVVVTIVPETLRVWEICESCELLVAASCESLRVVASYCELPSSHFCYTVIC